YAGSPRSVVEPMAPEGGLPAAGRGRDEHRDDRDEVQLAEDDLEHRERTADAGRRREIAEPGGRDRDEAVVEVLPARPVVASCEERGIGDVGQEHVDEAEE